MGETEFKLAPQSPRELDDPLFPLQETNPLPPLAPDPIEVSGTVVTDKEEEDELLPSPALEFRSCCFSRFI